MKEGARTWAISKMSGRYCWLVGKCDGMEEAQTK